MGLTTAKIAAVLAHRITAATSTTTPQRAVKVTGAVATLRNGANGEQVAVSLCITISPSRGTIAASLSWLPQKMCYILDRQNCMKGLWGRNVVKPGNFEPWEGDAVWWERNLP